MSLNVHTPEIAALFPSVRFAKRESVTEDLFAAPLEVRVSIIWGIVKHREEKGLVAEPQTTRDVIYLLRLKAIASLFFRHGLGSIRVFPLGKNSTNSHEDVAASARIQKHIQTALDYDCTNSKGYTAPAQKPQEVIIGMAFMSCLANVAKGNYELARKELVTADLLFWAMRSGEYYSRAR